MSDISENYIGNLDLLNSLHKKMINNNIANSILLSGAKGIGKTTLIFNLITKTFETFIGKNFRNNNKFFFNNVHDNVRYITRELDEKNSKLKKYINIEQIRKLDDFIFKFSVNHLPKIIIIDSADELNINSSNALLKILEEPKKSTFFILINHQLSNLLPTIRSRCINFNIDNPTYEDFNKILKMQNSNLKNEEIDLLYDISLASPGNALKLFSQDIKYIIDIFFDIIDNQFSFSNNINILSNIFAENDNEQIKNFISVFKFILISLIKIKLNYNLSRNFKSNISRNLEFISNKINNDVCFKMIEYLNNNENDLFVYNLDKKVFLLNFFSHLNIK